jgi:hypothetical protein
LNQVLSRGKEATKHTQMATIKGGVGISGDQEKRPFERQPDLSS